MINDVRARYAVDPRRIAMGGFSNGGMMAYRYACAGPSLVRTYFIGSGVAVPPSCSLGQPDRFLHMHGLLDTTVPWAGTTTSPLFTGGVVPAVASTIGYVSRLDGCGAFTSSAANTLVTKYAATGCPSGASYTVMLSTTMTHQWATGATAATTGMDETSLTWSWLGWAFSQG